MPPNYPLVLVLSFVWGGHSSIHMTIANAHSLRGWHMTHFRKAGEGCGGFDLGPPKKALVFLLSQERNISPLFPSPPQFKSDFRKVIQLL